MRVLGLDGRSHPWDLRHRTVGLIDPVERSGPHLAVRACLKRLFPTEPVLEEVPLPGSTGLTLDFFLPVRRTAVEAHGRQHREYVPFFHGTRVGFRRSLERDARKREWCELNRLRLVVLWWDGEDGWDRLLLA